MTGTSDREEAGVTMTAPPSTPGSQRIVPRYPTQEVVARLRKLVGGKEWVLRSSWERYLGGSDDVLLSPDRLTRDQRVAALAWLRQQRHRLYRALEGGPVAPEGWLEGWPLYQALNGDHAISAGPRRSLPG